MEEFYIYVEDIPRLKKIFGKEAKKASKVIIEAKDNFLAHKSYEKQISAIYGISRRHRVFIEWRAIKGSICMPDRWEIVKKNRTVACIYT